MPRRLPADQITLFWQAYDASGNASAAGRMAGLSKDQAHRLLKKRGDRPVATVTRAQLEAVLQQVETLATEVQAVRQRLLRLVALLPASPISNH
ncbi:hypothetical protein [Herpetosiphon gulosus]|uniref:Uncharacterized protein n=1 Tax=Herpetosiphon gulosus TaxID=1973496 RepID=A0ABP9X002_9CHLR